MEIRATGRVTEHLTLVRTHHRAPSRVAIVDAAWIKMAWAVMSQFLEAQTSYFEKDDFEGAKACMLA